MPSDHNDDDHPLSSSSVAYSGSNNDKTNQNKNSNNNTNSKWKVTVKTVIHDDENSSDEEEETLNGTTTSYNNSSQTKETNLSPHRSSSSSRSVEEESSESSVLRSLVDYVVGIGGRQRGRSDSGDGDGIFRDARRGLIHNDHDFESSPPPPPQEQQQQDERYTNERLLCTAFVTFLSFALLELVFAIIAGSEAMMGDSAAMIVDAMTYLFNLIAERRKTHLDDLVEQQEQQHYQQQGVVVHNNSFNRARYRRKLELQMEVLPPAVSVTTLVIVLGFVLRKSIRVLVLDMHRSRSEQANPSVGVMLIFSILNLFLDGVNVFCFAKANHLLGYDVVEYDEDDDVDDDDDEYIAHDEEESESEGDPISPPPPPRPGIRQESTTTPPTTFATRQHLPHLGKRRHYRQLGRYSNTGGGGEASNGDEDHGLELSEQPKQQQQRQPDCEEHQRHLNGGGATTPTTSNTTRSHEEEEEKEEAEVRPRGDDGVNAVGVVVHHNHHHHQANLNMCSAYTHVFADTLRSLAVIIACLVAEVTPAVTPEEADATAAVIVSFLIFLSLLPLVQGLTKSLSELQSIRAEERSDALRTSTIPI